jgi:glycosyltransferase involved in cell wall biosynthesis
VIINDGFNPTHLLSFLYAVINKIPHIPMTDGTDLSEKNFSFIHKLIRKIIYKRSASFISAAQGGKRLYASYGIPEKSCFLSCLCVDNEKFQTNQLSTTKIFDFIFCSRLEKEKNPEFAVQVAYLTASRLGKKCSLLFVGSGSLEASLKKLALQYKESLEIIFHGFATQNELPALYRSAKLFLFPTQADVWGIVVNEACAAGLPIITTPYAGVVNELVINNKNGYVRDLNAHAWVNCATELLSNPTLYANFSQHSLTLVAPYNFITASDGIKRAILHAMRKSQFSSRLMTTASPIKKIE